MRLWRLDRTAAHDAAKEAGVVRRSGQTIGVPLSGGESFVEMQTRIWTDLQRIRSEHPASTVVAVSHADPIKAAVAAALGLGLDMFQRLVVSPCSITPILFTPTGPIVLAINSTGDDLSQLVPS